MTAPTTLAELLEPLDATADETDARWPDDGVLVLPGLIPAGGLLERYMDAWSNVNDPHRLGIDDLILPARFDLDRWWQLGSPMNEDVISGETWGRWIPDTPHARPGGWPHATPYRDCPELLDLASYTPLHDALRSLTGEPCGLHLALTGMQTTTRDWHQDGYLNPAPVGDYYAAVWIALDDIHPASGPFQYVPGSHRWGRLTQHRIAEHVDLTDPLWPAHSEALLTPLVDAELAVRGVEPVSYVPKAGDVLVWHPRLMHRGSRAAVPGMLRSAVILHYSGIHHRPDMVEHLRVHEPVGLRVPVSGHYFDLPGRQTVGR